jgi:peptide-methionine (R)-S-oxide reductase
MRIIVFSFAIASLLWVQSCGAQSNSSTQKSTRNMESNQSNNPVYSRTDSSEVKITEGEWKKILPPDIYYIAREKGTERPWTSPIEHSRGRDLLLQSLWKSPF